MKSNLLVIIAALMLSLASSSLVATQASAVAVNTEQITTPYYKQVLCLYAPELELCSPDEKITENNGCPLNWAMNDDEQCYPAYISCPTGYWRAAEDESGACVEKDKEIITQQIGPETVEVVEEDSTKDEESALSSLSEDDEDEPEEEEAMGHDVSEKVEDEEEDDAE